MYQRISGMTIIGALAASLVLVGCGKTEQSGTGNAGSDSAPAVGRTDGTGSTGSTGGTGSMGSTGTATGTGSTSSTGSTGSTVGNDVATGVDKAKDAAANTTAKAGDQIDDAMITAGVKTELAKDANLSALRINVDTAAGRVALKGTAPSTAAKAQATMLAQNVKGVLSVDNQLTVKQ